MEFSDAIKTRKKSESADGVKIKFLVGIMIASLCVMLFITTMSVYRVKLRYAEIRSATNIYVTARDSIEELLNRSDFLTEQSRLYIMTADSSYANAYCYEIEVAHRREQAVERLAEVLSDDDRATKMLRDALDESNSLKNLELQAMKLVTLGHGYFLSDFAESIANYKLSDEDLALSKKEMIEKGRNLIFGSAYITSKSIIVNKSRTASVLAEKNIYSYQEQTVTKLKKAVVFQEVFILALVVASIFISLLIYYLVVHPLGCFVQNIDLHAKLPVLGSYECRYLAVAYNNFYDINMTHRSQLIYKAEHDSLTHLLNRGALAGLCKYLKNYSIPMALLVIDIDKFKEVNDTYGHQVGDSVIQFVANQLSKNFRNGDYIVRYGGDEFLVFMSRMSPEKFYLIERKVKQINSALREFCEGKYKTFSVSVGVSFSKSGYNEKMFPEADSALYYVKEHGRAGLAAYSPMMAIRKAKL